jgi:hypothetical protein
MKWEAHGSSLIHPGFISAKIVRDGTGALAEVRAIHIGRKDCDSIMSAEKWAEARMNELKKEFILSLITKESKDTYVLGKGILHIIGGYEGKDEWGVYGTGEPDVFYGTLEECKNYIASCF